mgnify:CR=1 FL=1
MSEHTCNPFGIACAGCRDVAQAWCDRAAAAEGRAEALGEALADAVAALKTHAPNHPARDACEAALASLPAQALAERRALEVVADASRPFVERETMEPGEFVRRLDALRSALATLDAARREGGT